MTFLGVELSTIDMTARLSQQKLQSYLDLVFEFHNKGYCTLKQFQRTTGRLQWACIVVLPGRAFLRIDWVGV